MSNSTFTPGGEHPISLLMETLGFQRAYSVNVNDEITETLVCVNTALEDNVNVRNKPPCGEEVHYETLQLAREHVFISKQAVADFLDRLAKERKATISYRVSSLWQSFFPSDKGVKPEVDLMAESAAKKHSRLDDIAITEMPYKALPQTLTCGVILPLGSSIYNLRADDILFDAKFTLGTEKVVAATPVFNSQKPHELSIRYVLSNDRGYMIDADDTCEDGVMKKCYSNSRYFVSPNAAKKTFQTLKQSVSLDEK